WVAVNALFADVLVQRSFLDDETTSSALWASIGSGCTAALLQASLSWPLAWSLSDTRLLAMSALLALPLPIVGAAGVFQGLLTRKRAYRALAARTVIGQGLGTLTGIAAALAGAGAWSLVMQQFVVSLGGASALLLSDPWRPHRTWRWKRVREMLHLGLPL